VVHDQVASLTLRFDAFCAAAPRWGFFSRLPAGKKAAGCEAGRLACDVAAAGFPPHGRFRPPIGCIVKKAAGNVPSGRPGWKFIQKELYPSRPDPSSLRFPIQSLES
jgi:hypothetical protein